MARQTLNVSTRSVTAQDANAWLRMRCDLWPDGTEAEHREEIERYLAGRSDEPLQVIVAVAESGEPIGIAELSIRPYAEGCRTRNVAYLEGWYVRPAARGRGVGRALIQATERWASSRGCAELASDAESDNDTSRRAHSALGFEEVGLIRCFRKEL